ncbi:MAG: alpha-E domain-containing protein [Gammaproteobacteria bacterium]|nr:alpha-E domain-containing protein [Gammaproteobacteria bacterium]
MLSRVANRTYWLARYLERAENTARLINVYSALLLDLPKSAEIGWDIVLEISGSREDFDATAMTVDEKSILRFMLEEEGNPNALLSVLNHARENARTSRDIVPTEAWRAVNELCLYAREQLPKAKRARQRSQIMNEIISRVHAVTGMLAGTMSQGEPYQFIRIGRNLERADMTTRIIDVAAATLLAPRKGLDRYDNTLWMAVLRCLSAYQMYRQYVRRRVNGTDVIEFLMRDHEFPRSFTHCLMQLSDALHRLPRAEDPVRCNDNLARQLNSIDYAALSYADIHGLVDELQVGIATINDSISTTWFNPAAME